ncbi:Alpha/Beta hydrolase protein [Lentinula aff. detonsa]|uniref:Alpha/Beta hydrolase protein n=1 Tax=Lentinula aff. detonsa TaxID=2804958 RepID=A0AA38NE27_9AGAR|nr:Alpha/Beta hydrolase protein [Lentinula aff. detonsa]KAJ3797124.1 Alpha/Beta hydrolase protein [Lentinula aff. detonsa]
MPFVRVKTSSGNIKFHYNISTPDLDVADKIDPAVPVLLWFHSLAFPHVFHSQFADPLLRKFNLVAFDFRSHGETEGDDLPEGYGIREAGEDALAFMDALRLPPCHFIAMDYGSPVALQIAISHPERVLSLFFISQTCLEEPPEVREGHQQVYDCWNAAFPGPHEYDNERMMEGGYGFAQFMFSNNMTKMADALFKISFGLSQKHWGYNGLKNYRIATLEFLLNRKSQPESALARIRCPVKLVYGTEDVAYPQEYNEEFQRQLENAGVDVSLLVVPGAPHFVSVEYADQVDPVLHDFVLRNDTRKPKPVSNTSLESPWDGALRSVGFYEGVEADDDSDEDNFVVSYPSSRT